MASKNSIDMINGSLWGKILKFSLIYMLTAVLQHLYTAADVIIVGRYAGETALAGVGTCDSVVNLFLNFILGLSAGATILLGQAIGANDREKISKASHTSIAVAVFGGLFISVICICFSKTFLTLIDVPQNVMPEALTYIRIVSIGFIPSLIYNFGAGILRAKGDTKRALYIVTASGIINVFLNLFFVCVCKMTASGVALATIISQIFTAFAILFILCRESDETRIFIRKIKIHSEEFLKILKFGLPSGIQSSIFSISNILVQSSINSFGAAAIAGSSAEASIAHFFNAMVNSFYQSAIVFSSQNFGARKLNRIKKTICICMTYVVAVWVIQSALTFFGGEYLLKFYIKDNPEVVEWGLKKFNILGYSYIFLGFMNIMSGALRGMGASLLNMITSILGVCGIRILWVLTIFPLFKTFESLFICYPLSWLGTFIMHFIMFCIVFKKEKQIYENNKTVNLTV